MLTPSAFASVFQTSPARTAELLFTDPAQIEGKGPSSLSTAWKLLLGSMALRKAGHLSEANDWLNHATRAKAKDDLFRAELLTEAGLGLKAADRYSDALEMLNSAEPIWRDLTSAALAIAAGKPEKAKAKALTPSFAELLVAGGVPLSGGARDVAKEGDARIAKMWLDQRAVVRRAENSATFARILIMAQQLEDATRICTECLDWTLANFTTPAGPLKVAPVQKRVMPSTAREGLYMIRLAQGEIELAAGRFQSSADAFEGAAAIYDGNVTDYTDISRLLRAKFNQANSLLRLGRYKEVFDIYDLVEHGFHSIGDKAAAQRVAQSRLIAQSKQADAKDS